MTPTKQAHLAVFAVWRPHMGALVAQERAAQVACCYDPTDPPPEDMVRQVVEHARLECYGAVDLSDDAVERLTQGALLALSGVR